MIPALALSPVIVGLLVALFLIVCVVLMLTVLIQRPQGGGLSGAFGAGGGAGQTAFGTKTGDALTFATIAMFLIYLGFAIGLNFAARPENITSSVIPTVQSSDASDAAPGAPADLPATDPGADGFTPESLIVPATDDAPEQPAESPAGDDAPITPPGDTADLDSGDGAAAVDPSDTAAGAGDPENDPAGDPPGAD